MSSKKALTITNELTDKINNLLEDEQYLDPNSLLVRTLRKDCDKLASVSAADAWISRARIAQLTGSNEDFDYAINNSQKLDPTDEWRATQVIGLLNLHRYSEAQNIVINMLEPQLGWFNSMYKIALRSGAILAVYHSSIDHQGAIGIVMTPDFPHEFVSKCANFMREQNIADADVGRMLDLAGQVMRKMSCMDIKALSWPKLVKTGESEVLHFRFLLQRNPEQVAEANMELALLMAESDLAHLDGLHVSFGSAL